MIPKSVLDIVKDGDPVGKLWFAAGVYHARNPQQSMLRSMWDTLWMVNPGLCSEAPYDARSDDSNVPAFMEWVEEVWVH